MLQVVWFKRDLRLHDHTALLQASRRGPLLCLYVFEPDYWQLPDTSQRQWDFTRECLQDLHLELQVKGASLCVCSGQITDILNQLLSEFGAFTLHSHEETGNLWTYQRDIAVGQWCQEHNTRWHEYPQMGVRRRQRDRDDWAEAWNRFMSQPCASSPLRLDAVSCSGSLLPSQWPRYPGNNNQRCPGRQRGGRRMALQVLDSFLSRRGEFYRGSISSPLTAEDGCSRLSPYLALGCISVRELLQRLRQARAQSRSVRWNASLAAFESRLWWHCHFIQKLEDEPDMEIRALHPATEALQRELNPAWLRAWQEGRTGWPLADACMRYLHHHGWLNFRMRAMLVSLASYPLWQPWQPVAQHLAALFTDYEPGIHYPQVQMQAGTTGINIPRMYNPVLQSQRLDPEGEFIRRWVPELRNVSNQWIHEPWLMTLSQQEKADVIIGADYPAPLVEFSLAVRDARARMSAIRNSDFKNTAALIGERHGSRRRSAPKTQRQADVRQKKARDAGQLSLF